MTTSLTPEDLIMDQEVVYNNAIYTVKGLSENWVWLSGMHTRITVRYNHRLWGGYLLEPVPEKWIKGKRYHKPASFDKFEVTAVDKYGNALIVWETDSDVVGVVKPEERKDFQEIS